VDDEGSYVITRPTGLGGLLDLTMTFLPNMRLFGVVFDDVLGGDLNLGAYYGVVDEQGPSWRYQFEKDRLGRMALHADGDRPDGLSWISDPFEYRQLINLPLIGEALTVSHDAVLELTFNEPMTRILRGHSLAVIDQPQLQAQTINATLLITLVSCNDLCDPAWCASNIYPAHADEIMACNYVTPDTVWNDPVAGSVPAYTMEFEFTASEDRVNFR
jgi:hypothetical protein